MIEYESLHKANKELFGEYREEFNRLLETGWYVLGQSVTDFEKEFAESHKLNHFVGVASGLDALIFSLICSDLPEGSEVIVPSNTYIATILAILRAGYKPVLVEPDIRTYNIDPSKIEAAITPKTKALMIVHLYGKTCDMDPIVELAKEKSLTLIEDCAQAHGAKYKGQPVGSFGNFSAFSFYPTKNMGALGDAGGIAFKDAKYLEQTKAIRNYGSGKKYEFDIAGYNSRLDEIQAGFLRIKLKYLDKINAQKRKLAKVYLNEVKGDFALPQVGDIDEHVFHIFNIRHPERDRLRQYLTEAGIGTEIHYPIAPHRQKALEGEVSGSYPISDEIHSTTLSLPISWFHTEEQVRQVAKVLNQF